jgi:peptidoglycan/xylan/chitin deacetylase (PgdA/CDA1 family)
MREFFELGPPRPCPEWISDRFRERIAQLGGVPPLSSISLQNAQRILDGELPPVFYGGAKNEKLIALTFDDGPRESTTQRLLEILAEYGAKATFYLQGTQVERFPGLARKIVEQGHEIGNHTFFHSNLITVSDEDLRNELIFANRIIEEATGVVPMTFRPPGGKRDERVVRASNDLGMVVAMWTINPIDYTRPSSSNISTLILNQARNGSVVLLHEGVEPTVQMLPGLLKALRHDGFRFVTVTELIEARMLAQKSSTPSSSRGGGKRRRG